jgi:hypothetical protein
VGAAQRKKKLGINISLKGPSMKSSCAGIFTQIRSVWIGEKETWTKTSRPRKIFKKMFNLLCLKVVFAWF